MPHHIIFWGNSGSEGTCYCLLAQAACRAEASISQCLLLKPRDTSPPLSRVWWDSSPSAQHLLQLNNPASSYLSLLQRDNQQNQSISDTAPSTEALCDFLPLPDPLSFSIWSLGGVVRRLFFFLWLLELVTRYSYPPRPLPDHFCTHCRDSKVPHL